MLAALRQIVEEISRIPILEDALQCVAQRLTETMQVDCCAIYLADHDQKNFLLVATDGLAKEAIGHTRVGFAEGLIGLIGQREEPINIDDAQAHPRFKHYPEVKEESYHAFLGTPIIHQRKVLGVLSIQQKSRRKFAEEEEALLITLAAQMALEVANAEARGLFDISSNKGKTQVWQKSILGRPGSPGLAIGTGYSPDQLQTLAAYPGSRSGNPASEISQYREAVKRTKADIVKLTDRIDREVPEDVANIFHLYDHLLDAASLGRAVEEKIRSGFNAATALKQVVESYAQQFRQMSDPYMRERAVDVVDLGNRVFRHLLQEETNAPDFPEQAILVAQEVSATMLADCPRENLKGVISVAGSDNSHAAIVAKAMGVPAVMGINDVPLSLFSDKEILLDGYSGEVTIAPDRALKTSFLQLIEEESSLQAQVDQEQQLPAETLDGDRVNLFLNIGLSLTTDVSEYPDVDGVGLYRTEIPFMQHERFPGEQEQTQLYRTLLRQFKGKPVTMRTLDVGGDKPLPYFPFQEENPFLGWRGIRMTLDHPEIFLVQVRAMLQASIDTNNLNIMLPMVTSLEEVREAKRLIRQAFYEVSEEAAHNNKVLRKPKVGVMLEVPAVLYQLPQLAELVDFFSVGSNDLTQYLLAVDRNNARVSDLYDSYHPAVIRALQHIAKESKAHGIPVTVCGEMASDPGGVLLLLAMGFDKLSINGHSQNRVKWIIRRLSQPGLGLLFQAVLDCNDAAEARELVNMELERLGLGGLVRAGY